MLDPPAARAGLVDLGDGVVVARMGFGAMRVGRSGQRGAPSDRASVRKLLSCAHELGVNFIDTADAYGPGTGEELIAWALHPYPNDLVIATKGGVIRPASGEWLPDGRPEHLRAACEASLRRLRVETISLYQLHAVDPDVPIEESVGALGELRQAGKVRLIGLSNVDSDQLRRAQTITSIASVQNRYNLVDRTSEPILAACDREGLVFITWAPLERGALADHGGLLRVAERRRARAAQVALAWQLGRSPQVLTIPGTSSAEHLRENVAAASLRLDERDLNELEALRDETEPTA